MSITVRSGIVPGLLVGLWTFVMGFTGWYKDPALLIISASSILFTTPCFQALVGLIGTVVTGVVVSANAGASLRKK